MNFGIGFIHKAESRTFLETQLPSMKGIELESFSLPLAFKNISNYGLPKRQMGTCFSNHKK
jgi:hypothetical protein